MSLRNIVEQYVDHPWYIANKKNIDFELNHLELHYLDSYLLNLYNQEINVGPNPNNSNIAYLIGLTEEEPTGRIKTVGGGFPDIDEDFEQGRRDEVFEYLKDKYGEGFAHIGIFGIAKAKGIFKDVCRIQDVPFTEANEWSKLFPDMSESIQAALEESKDLKAKYDSDPDFKEIVDYASKMEGCIKSVGSHPCGILLADSPISDYVALFESKGSHIAQVDGETAENIGLVKFDVLGLKTLDVINKAFGLVRSRYADFQYKSPYDIPTDDEATYKLLATTNLLACFQIEGDALTQFTAQCAPKNIEDLAAILSIYRPGPMNLPGYLSTYIKRSNGRETGNFIIPKYDYIFKDTYAMLLYQEQFMQLAADMCGFNDIEVDALRKAVGKKDAKKLAALKNQFIEGAVRSGEDRAVIEKFWLDLEEMARYCFNKSHAVSYALLTYYTAYFKANYPSEFFTACITYETDVAQKSAYIEDARKNGINVLPPDINQSLGGFNISKDGSILFGFNGIKGLGDKVIEKIVKLRPYKSFGDFLIKGRLNGITKAHVEVLIHSGAMDCFGFKRSCMVRSFEKFMSDVITDPKKPPAEQVINAHIAKQSEYFEDDGYSEFTLLSILENEQRLLGVYVSGNPFTLVREMTNESYVNISTFQNEIYDHGNSGYVLCQVRASKKHTSKNGNAMMFVDCLDYLGETFSAPLFSNVDKYGESLEAGRFVLLYLIGKHGSKGKSIQIQSVVDLTNALNKSTYVKADRDIKLLNLNFIDAPGTVQLRSLMNKIGLFISSVPTEFTLNVNIDIGTHIYHINKFYLSDISIDIIRELNKIPNIYLTRHINGSARL